ncbi:MAG: hypothetical protein DHS20C12_01150 [Pseudohongiella sp.]|nr:MAG: hypothetical protein DHS20C12_01150 [Pseudohongiella sp.]
MNEVKMNLDWRQYDIRWIAVAASLALSVFTLLLQEIPNADAYTYVRTAEIFLADGIVAAYQHYSWASYSILIGLVSLTGMDMFSAGLFVNALFYALLVYAFLSIVVQIDNSKELLVVAAISILVYPQLNEYRDLLIRDIGFWALAVAALWQYMLYANDQSLKSAIAFCACLLLATLFRAEAAVYLVCTPLALLFDARIEKQQRKTLLLRVYAIVASLSLGLLLCLSLIGLNITQLFIEFTSIYEPFISGNFTLTDEERALLGSLLFSDYASTFSREYIELFLLAGMISILLANLLTGIGGPYLILMAVGLFKGQLRLPPGISTPVVFYLCANFLILLSFIIVTRYLSSRYAMLMSILLVLFVPTIISGLLNNAKQAGRRSTFYIVAIFFGYCAIDSYISFGKPKTYVDESIEWLAENTGASAQLITNNHAIAYFSGKIEDYDLIERNLTAEEILTSDAGDTIAAELTFETRTLLERAEIAEQISLLATFPDTEAPRIAVFEKID